MPFLDMAKWAKSDFRMNSSTFVGSKVDYPIIIFRGLGVLYLTQSHIDDFFPKRFKTPMKRTPLANMDSHSPHI